MDNEQKIQHLIDLEILQKAKITNNQLLACCPFHSEETPSWGLNLETGQSNCFSCQEKSGSYEHFFRLIKHHYQIDLLPKKQTFENKLQELSFTTKLKLNKIKKTVEKIEEFNIEKYNFLKIQYSDPLDKYIHKRISNDWIIQQFEISYSKKKNQYLFPIKNHTGKIVGYAIRQFKHPKYLYNSGFQKNKVLFGSHLINFENNVGILTEGPFDVMQSLSNGGENVVSILGAKLSEEQLNLLTKFFSKIIIAMDNDEPGQICAKDAKKRLSKQLGYKNVKLFDWSLLPNKKDLGELTSSEFFYGIPSI